MSGNIKNILLVDDDETTNFYNKYLIKNSEHNIENIYEVANGQEALEKLNELHELGIRIDLILLDINMPIMNGFEFLDEYEKLDTSFKSGMIVCMLTSSTHGWDLVKAKEYDSVNHYMEKGLTQEKINELSDMYSVIQSERKKK